jgi:hypothetical protein
LKGGQKEQKLKTKRKKGGKERMDKVHINRVLYFDSDFGNQAHDEEDDKILAACICVQDRNVAANVTTKIELDHLQFQRGTDCPFKDVAELVIAGHVFNRWLLAEEPGYSVKLQEMKIFDLFQSKFNRWFATQSFATEAEEKQ